MPDPQWEIKMASVPATIAATALPKSPANPLALEACAAHLPLSAKQADWLGALFDRISGVEGETE